MQPQNAEYDRSRERAEMVEWQLARRGIRSSAVLDAMRQVPRELFLPQTLAGRAYEDSALPIDCGQTISQPYMVACMTELLELQPDSRVLEIGTGSGYQTAILSLLAEELFSIEWHLGLMTAAAERLQHLGRTNVAFRCGDGSMGWPEHAPFEGIIVTAGAPDVPEPLKEQLAVGGRLVIPIGPYTNQTLVRVVRIQSGYVQEEHVACRFVKLVGRMGWHD